MGQEEIKKFIWATHTLLASLSSFMASSTSLCSRCPSRSVIVLMASCGQGKKITWKRKDWETCQQQIYIYSHPSEEQKNAQKIRDVSFYLHIYPSPSEEACFLENFHHTHSVYHVTQTQLINGSRCNMAVVLLYLELVWPTWSILSQPDQLSPLTPLLYVCYFLSP